MCIPLGKKKKTKRVPIFFLVHMHKSLFICLLLCLQCRVCQSHRSVPAQAMPLSCTGQVLTLPLPAVPGCPLTSLLPVLQSGHQSAEKQELCRSYSLLWKNKKTSKRYGQEREVNCDLKWRNWRCMCIHDSKCHGCGALLNAHVHPWQQVSWMRCFLKFQRYDGIPPFRWNLPLVFC